jgi:hypothetical protein
MVNVIFVVDAPGVADGQTVHVMGSQTGFPSAWDPAGEPMTRLKDDIWGIMIPMPLGAHVEYLYTRGSAATEEDFTGHRTLDVAPQSGQLSARMAAFVRAHDDQNPLWQIVQDIGNQEAGHPPVSRWRDGPTGQHYDNYFWGVIDVEAGQGIASTLREYQIVACQPSINGTLYFRWQLTVFAAQRYGPYEGSAVDIPELSGPHLLTFATPQMITAGLSANVIYHPLKVSVPPGHFLLGSALGDLQFTDSSVELQAAIGPPGDQVYRLAGGGTKADITLEEQKGKDIPTGNPLYAPCP